MTNYLSLRRAITTYPTQCQYWLDRTSLWSEPTSLLSDRMADANPSGYSAVAYESTVAVDVAAALATITGGHPLLERVLAVSATAIAVSRAVDKAEVTLLTAVGVSSTRQLIPVTTAFNTAPTGKDLLSQIRTDLITAGANADVPVLALLREEGVNPSHIVVNVNDEDLELPDNEHVLVEVSTTGANMTVRVTGPHTISASTVKRLSKQVVRALGILAQRPTDPLRPLFAADPEDEAQLAVWNATDARYPADMLLHSFFFDRARQTPNAVAVIESETGRTITYAELSQFAASTADRLAHHGVTRGDVVAVAIPRSARELAAIYGVLLAGGAYLPIDASLPQSRIDYMLRNAGVKVVIGDGSLDVSNANAHTIVLGELDDAPVVTNAHALATTRTTPDDVAYVIYTSGSTGRPKGVAVSHRAIVNRLTWMQRAYPLDAQDSILHKTPFTFDVSVWEIFWWSLAGSHVVTLANGSERDPDAIARTVADFAISTIHFVPSMLGAFLEYVTHDPYSRLQSLRTVFTSGEALKMDHARSFTNEFPAGAALVNLYGPTEAAVDVTCQEVVRNGRLVVDSESHIPIGRPIDNIRMTVHTQDGKVAPIGTPGELCISGIGLAVGYVNAPELTAERFVTGDERLYRTGDLARWTDAGVIDYLGRIDTQVKIRGYRIELSEIEHAICRHEAIADAAVTLLAIDGGSALVAYVVPRDESDSPSTRSVRDHLSTILPDYMVPQHVVLLPVIPTTANGKRDLKSLPARTVTAATQQPREERSPRSEKERILADIWSEVLGVSNPGMTDDFFGLGGDSIRFIGVLARARRHGLKFTFQDLFANPTIEGLASVAVSLNPDEALAPRQSAPLARFMVSPDDEVKLPSDAVDAYPMTQLQLGLIYEAGRSKSAGMYHDVLSYRINEPFDEGCFEAAVAHVIGMHPILRTSFHLASFTEPLQVVHRSAGLSLRVHDISEFDGTAQDLILREFHSAEVENEFVLDAIDLVRFHVHILSPESFQYTLSYHDAALDGWSVNTLHRDVFSAYFTSLSGDEPQVEDVSASYRDFVVLERAAVESVAQQEFWADVLRDSPDTRLPRISITASGDSSAVAIEEVPLPSDLSNRLASQCRELRVPLKSVLLAAHVAVLAFINDELDVMTGYEHSGRPELEGGDAIAGLFLNTIPFRVKLAQCETWADLVRRVYDAEARMLPHRRFPMAEMKKRLSSRDMIFESVFNFTHFRVLKDLSTREGFSLVRGATNAQTEFPLRAEFSQHAVTDEVQFSIHFHTSQFSLTQVRQFASFYVEALENLCGRAHHALNLSALLTTAEEARVRSFSGPEIHDSHTTPLSIIAEMAQTQADSVALQDADTTLTYAELDHAANVIAADLARAGVIPGNVVATMLPRGLAWGAAVLGVMRAGAVYLPLDQNQPTDRISAMLRRSGCRALLIPSERAGSLPAEIAANNPNLATIDLNLSTLLSSGVDGPSRSVRDLDPAYVIFTSGSTGEPKGAMVHHGGLLNHLLAKVEDLDLSSDDHVAQTATQLFDISVWQLMAAWLVGGRTVIYQHDQLLAGGSFVDALARDSISVVELVPSYLDALLLEVPTLVLERLRFVLVTGEAMPPALTGKWFANNDVPLVNAYGPTEASDDVTHHILRAPVDGTRTPVGRPIRNTGIHVVSTDGSLRPIGTYGEICVTGVGVGLGYLNDADRTKAVFRENTLDSRSSWMYRTGDIGRWLPDGALDCAGRTDHQVKVHGYRIELSEIDIALETVAGISQAITTVRTFDGDQRIVAFCTPTPGNVVPSAEDIATALKRRLPDYMHPKHVVPIESLPLTGNGKVDRRALASMAVTDHVVAKVTPPASAGEEYIVQLFARVLDRDQSVISTTAGFFEMGGHSLSAMRVAAMSDGRITIPELLAYPSARELAAKLAARDAGLSSDDDGSHRSLLINLSTAVGHEPPENAPLLVVVPFAGGRAVSYLAVARELSETHQVLGVELPARSQTDSLEPAPIEEIASILAAELSVARGARPMTILGHCAGTGVSLELAALFADEGNPVESLIVVSKLLESSDPGHHASNDVVNMSQDEIMEWLVANTDLDGVAAFSSQERADIAEAFRYDTAQASRAYQRQLTRAQESSKGVGCAIELIYARDDSLAIGREHNAEIWNLFGPTESTVLTHGGHYLQESRPSEIARLVRKSTATPNDELSSIGEFRV